MSDAALIADAALLDKDYPARCSACDNLCEGTEFMEFKLEYDWEQFKKGDTYRVCPDCQEMAAEQLEEDAEDG